MPGTRNRGNGTWKAWRRVLLASCASCAFALLGAGTAAAVPTNTAVFSPTGAEQVFVVPEGVTSVHVAAIGGQGGDRALSTSAPKGANVASDLAVTPGQVLYVEVGGNGAFCCAAFTATAGGFNGGGAGGAGTTGAGGGGGGASDVRLVPSSATGSLQSRLIVAAGGGGVGPACVGCGGEGGAAGSPGTMGDIGGGGGGAGTANAGGAGGPAGSAGDSDGTGGALGTGGDGGTGAGSDSGGGGGGGGYYGGGGGGAGADGGGGGGGSSFTGAGTSNASVAADTTGSPSVAITYWVPEADLAPDPVNFTGTQPQGTVSGSRAVTVSNTGSAPLVIDGLDFSGDDDFFVSSNGCPHSLAAGAQCVIRIRFAPQAAGSRTGTFSLASNDPSGAKQVTLNGTGGALPKGDKGDKGDKGAKGDRGPRGFPGRDASVTCKVAKPKQKKGSKTKHVKVTCVVKYKAGSTRVVSARLSRHGVTYARGGSSSGHRLRMRSLRAVAPGKYRLTVTSRHGGATTTESRTVRVA